MHQPSDPESSQEHRLPVRANLEHLRNEAKLLLRNLREQQSNAKLADAQAQVARNYGFRSWRQLKSHVDTLTTLRSEIVAAVRTGDLAGIRRVLDSTPEMVDASTDLQEHVIRPSDARAMRLVHLAIAENQEAALRLLIEYGANLDVRNQDGRLPLHDCFELGRDHLSKLLLDAGAKPDVCAAAAWGMADRLLPLLREHPECANDFQTGISPLGWCVYGDHVNCAEILLANGAVLNRPPFDAAVWQPTAHVASTKFASLFLAYSANPNCQDREGNTPVHLAIKSRLVLDPSTFVTVLVQAGADPGIRNNQGRTPLDEAKLQVDHTAQTYFPSRPVGVKKMDATIALLTKISPTD